MKRPHWIIVWCGAGLVLLVAVIFTVVGLCQFGGQQFWPSFYGAVISAAISATVALVLVVLAVRIDRRETRKKLSGARFGILATTGEELRSRLLDYLDVFGIYKPSIAVLIEVSHESWRSASRQRWPQKRRWESIKQHVSSGTPGRSFKVNEIRKVFRQLEQLLESVHSIAELAKSSQFFVGHESTASKAVVLDSQVFAGLWSELRSFDLTLVSKPNVDYEIPEVISQYLKRIALESCDLFIALIRVSNEIEL